MDLRHYATVLLRRWPLILAFAALAAGAAYAYASRAPLTYRATAHLSVTPSEIEFFTGEAVQRLLNNYSIRLRSKSFAAEFAPRLSPRATADEVAGKVRAVAAPQEFRISVEVDDADPVRAQQIANAAAYQWVEKIRAEVAAWPNPAKQAITLEVFEPAETPGSPFSPRPRRDAFGGALVGVIVGCVAAILLEALDDTVKTAAEAETLSGLVVLGRIPRRGRTGVLNGLFQRATGGARSRRTSDGARPGGPPGDERAGQAGRRGAVARV